MEKIAIIGNGLIVDYDIIKNLISKYPKIIVADGGLLHCRKMNLSPILIVGDFDSATQSDVEFYIDVPKKTYPVDKDLTDLELAIHEAFERGAKKIALFGALGKRIDHGLKNLNLVYQFTKELVIESEYETIFAVSGEEKIDCFPGQTLSLIPFGNPAIGVTTSGLKWELQNAVLNNNFLSISNVSLGNSFTISINSGTILCCLVRNPEDILDL